MNEPRVDVHSTAPMHGHCCGPKCLSWSAVIAGALVAVGLSFLLNLFGVALGLTAFTMGPDGSATLAIGGFVGLVICFIVAMFVAGAIAGYLGRPYCTSRHGGELYGFTAWCVALVLGVFLAAHTGMFVSHVSDTVYKQPGSSSVSTTTDNASPMITTEAKRNSDNSKSTHVTVNTEKAAATTAFATFFLFFIGALASCFGGRCGMSCHRKTVCPPTGTTHR